MIVVDKNKGPLFPEDQVYFNIEDVPVDEYHDNDGDNSVLHNTTMNKTFAVAADHIEQVKVSTTPPKPNLVVVFPRTTKKGDAGSDVLAVKRALSRAKFRKWDVSTKTFGATLEKQLKNFQQAKGLAVDGEYGPATHAKLKGFFDQYGAWLMLQEQNLLNPRNKIKNAAIFGYNNRYGIHYTQGTNRMYGVRNKIRPPQTPLYEDCSSFATWCYWLAGVPDPNNLHYSGYGYTGTLASHGLIVNAPNTGDLSFYGPVYPFKHVTIYVGGGKCVSHGSEDGPLLLYYRYRNDYHYTRSYIF